MLLIWKPKTYLTEESLKRNIKNMDKEKRWNTIMDRLDIDELLASTRRLNHILPFLEKIANINVKVASSILDQVDTHWSFRDYEPSESDKAEDITRILEYCWEKGIHLHDYTGAKKVGIIFYRKEKEGINFLTFRKERGDQHVFKTIPTCYQHEIKETQTGTKLLDFLKKDLGLSTYDFNLLSDKPITSGPFTCYIAELDKKHSGNWDRSNNFWSAHAELPIDEKPLRALAWQHIVHQRVKKTCFIVKHNDYYYLHYKDGKLNLPKGVIRSFDSAFGGKEKNDSQPTIKDIYRAGELGIREAWSMQNDGVATLYTMTFDTVYKNLCHYFLIISNHSSLPKGGSCEVKTPLDCKTFEQVIDYLENMTEIYNIYDIYKGTLEYED